MMYQIAKEFTFEASHQLTGLPPDHKCSRLHGHSYVVELSMKSWDVNLFGFVMDYQDMDEFGAYIAEHLDHRHLNDIVSQPTAEKIAHFLYSIAKTMWPSMTISVRVSETRKTWASYEGNM